MHIEEIKNYLQRGVLGWRYKSPIAIDSNMYYPIAIDYSFNPPIYHLFDYSEYIKTLLHTQDNISRQSITKLFLFDKYYTKYNLNLLSIQQTLDIIKTNQHLFTKLNDILIQNKLIEQINNFPVEHL